MADKTSFKDILPFAGYAFLYLFLGFLSKGIGFISPFCWTLFSALAAFLAAWPVFKAIKRNGGRCILLSFGILLILFNFLEFSPFTVVSSIVSLVIVVAAELIHRSVGYGSRKALRIAYPLFAFTPFSYITGLWYDTAAYCQDAVAEMGVPYCEKMSHLGNVWALVFAAAAIIVMSLVAIELFYKEEK